MSHIVIGNSRSGKPAIHGAALAALPLAEMLAWLVAIVAGQADLLSLNLALLPAAFGISPTTLRESRRVAGHTIKPRRRGPATLAPVPSPVSIPIVDALESLRKVIAETAKQDEVDHALAAKTAKTNSNGATVNSGARS
jgi:hypothetical protein